jgi:uncharacterized protein YprB with RNaseH-like and TPR domain
MNDLRSRIAAIVERDRARRGELGVRGGGGVGTETLSTRETPSLRDGDPSRAGALGASAATPRDASSAPPFSVFEQRIVVDDLGLQIVGRGAPDPLLIAHLGLKGDAPARWEDVLWLDTETTGLAGGTGTYVFLLGIAYFCEGELVLRQHLLHDIGYEREFVETIQAEIEPFRACASYNGKSFDLPLLRTRWVMTLRSEITVDESHLDLLHPARRLWRDRYGSTGLKQLEESLFDEGRINDIPGSLIPDAYFHYLRKHDPAIIAPVLEHNARDIVSLVRVADRVAVAVLAARTGRAPDHAPAAYALARSFERTGELDAAFACFESAYFDGDNELRVKLALAFARQLERRSDVERALRMVETLLELGLGSERWREQAASRVRRLTKKRWRQLATAS